MKKQKSIWSAAGNRNRTNRAWAKFRFPKHPLTRGHQTYLYNTYFFKDLLCLDLHSAISVAYLTEVRRSLAAKFRNLYCATPSLIGRNREAREIRNSLRSLLSAPGLHRSSPDSPKHLECKHVASALLRPSCAFRLPPAVPPSLADPPPPRSLPNSRILTQLRLC